jgi:hypothetical protein
MTGNERISRRKFAATVGSIGITGIAGCTGGGDDSSADDSSTSDSTTSDDDSTTTEDETSTEADTSSDSSLEEDGVIDSLADYEQVTSDQETWRDREISCPEVSYYEPYGDYEGFRALFDEGTRPFFIDTEENFMSSDRVAFTGSIEKFGEIQDTDVIYVVDATFETP